MTDKRNTSPESPATGQAFDLNIEKVLEHWTIPFAIRELIANALDEQALTGTSEPVIFKDSDGCWHAADAGRGVQYEHLTQNENAEKRRHPQVIGQFGMGLKDALAVFDRRGVGVVIRSAHADITTGRRPKDGFPDVVTLHALVSPPSGSRPVGNRCCPDRGQGPRHRGGERLLPPLQRRAPAGVHRIWTGSSPPRPASAGSHLRQGPVRCRGAEFPVLLQHHQAVRLAAPGAE
jgi:hypothetical protein